MNDRVTDKVQVQLRGRRMSDNSQYDGDKSKVLAYVLTIMMTVAVMLISYLCVQSQKQGELLSRMEERTGFTLKQYESLKQEFDRKQTSDDEIRNKLTELQITAAEHGWKRKN